MTGYIRSLLLLQGACFLIGAGIATLLVWMIETPHVSAGWLLLGLVLGTAGSFLQRHAVRLKAVGR